MNILYYLLVSYLIGFFIFFISIHLLEENDVNYANNDKENLINTNFNETVLIISFFWPVALLFILVVAILTIEREPK